MFTIKLYSDDGYRNVIRAAESFTILRNEGGEAEITLHQKGSGEDSRIDIKHYANPEGGARVYDRAIIENAAGKTTEIIDLGPKTRKKSE